MSASFTPTFAGLSGKSLGNFISIIMTFGFVLVGYDQGVMSGIIGAPIFVRDFPTLENNPTMDGFTVAVYDIGCLLGALLVMAFADRLGRKKSMWFGALFVIFGVLIQVLIFSTDTSSPNALIQLIMGRFVTGIGNGINMAAIPVYQSECTKPGKRGAMIAIEGGLIATGTMLAYWLNYGVRNYSTSFTWRFPIAFQIVLVMVYFIGSFFVPESPRWLFKQDRVDEATVVCAALNAEPIDGAVTQEECRMIIEALKADNAINAAVGYRDLLRGGHSQYLRRCLLGAGLQFMQQMGGCNAVIYFLPILFRSSLNMDNEMALLLGGVNMIVYALFSLTTYWLIENVGRRRVVLWGAVGHSLSMTITFACLIPGTVAAANGAAFGLFMYIAFFGSTWLIIPWLYPAEINPLMTRVKANSIACVTNWTSNFVIVMVTPIMVARIGWGTYLFFAAINALYVPIIYVFYPETRGRSLEEIDFIFAKGHAENMSYVRAAKEMPALSGEDMARLAEEYHGSGVKVCKDEEADVAVDVKHG